MGIQLDNLEFLTPLVEIERRDGTKMGLKVQGSVWQRRFRSLWDYIGGIRLPVTLDFPNTASGASSPLSVTVNGASLGDKVSIAPVDAALISAGSFYTGVVSAAGTVTALFVNLSGAPINPPSGVFNIQVTPQ